MWIVWLIRNKALFPKEENLSSSFFLSIGQGSISVLKGSRERKIGMILRIEKLPFLVAILTGQQTASKHLRGWGTTHFLSISRYLWNVNIDRTNNQAPG